MQVPKQNKLQDVPTENASSIEPQDLLDYNLSLTPEDRLLNHQRALDTINELIKARKQIYGELESSTETPS
jgi:hypothetical protein